MADTLKERLQSDLKDAMRSGDTFRRDTVRLLISEVKKKEIDLRHQLEREEELQLLQTQAKQRRESIEQFQAGGRDDLAAKDLGTGDREGEAQVHVAQGEVGGVPQRRTAHQRESQRSEGGGVVARADGDAGDLRRRNEQVPHDAELLTGGDLPLVVAQIPRGQPGPAKQHLIGDPGRATGLHEQRRTGHVTGKVPRRGDGPFEATLP